MSMGDMEEHEVELLREDARLEAEEALITPAVMQIVAGNRENRDIYSVDCNKVTVVGVRIRVHAKAEEWKIKHCRYFVEVTGRFLEYFDENSKHDCKFRSCELKCVHRIHGAKYAITMIQAKIQASLLIGSSDYLNRHLWWFNV